jgi:polyhydroxyalkanoate synthase
MNWTGRSRIFTGPFDPRKPLKRNDRGGGRRIATGEYMAFEVKEGISSLNSEAQNLQRRIMKATELLLNPPDVDVGTAPYEVVHEDGKMKLLHYIPQNDNTHDVPLLIIYALINKPYILDLQPDRSVIRNLLSEGFDIYMIDWGTPTDVDRYVNLDDYVNWYIDDVVDIICQRHDMDSISILGYCMGGTLSVMYVATHPEKVRNFILMAAPLDFEADMGLLKLWAQKEYYDPDKLVEIIGNIPGEFLNFGFLLLDPVSNLYSKYLKFAEKVDDEEFVKMFFRMEKWINDGIPLAGEAYREFIRKLYQENQIVKNQLRLNSDKVDLNNITMPLLSLVATYDHLVPPESSRGFNDLCPSKDKKMIEFPTGHIGLSVSSATHKKLWPEVALWLKERSQIEPEDNPKKPTKKKTRRTAVQTIKKKTAGKRSTKRKKQK